MEVQLRQVWKMRLRYKGADGDVGFWILILHKTNIKYLNKVILKCLGSARNLRESNDHSSKRPRYSLKFKKNSNS